MLAHLAVILLLTIGGQSSQPADIARAEAVARAGKTKEAIALFRQILDAAPANVDAQVWLARLLLRNGQPAEAEAVYRAVLKDHPDHVDALIGFARVLFRTNRYKEALEILYKLEADPANARYASLYSALARALRMSGDDLRAVDYFEKAHALAPEDPEGLDGLEATIRAVGHWLGAEIAWQEGSNGGESWNGLLAGSFRAHPRLFLQAAVRTRSGPDYADALAGGGVFWRAGRRTTLSLHVLGGSENVALANRDVSAGFIQYRGPFEPGFEARHLDFLESSVTALSPSLAWNASDSLRFDGRYTYSRSSLSGFSDSVSDHSGLLRSTWQARRRLAIQAGVAYGIESFADLTADRIASLGATTVALALRLDAPSVTRLTVAWELQRREDNSTFNRFTVSAGQSWR